jgi:AcrR family transcriptional regulator
MTDSIFCPITKMRSRIVEAAYARFHHYGLGKTTMAEIASDLGMSPGNLYRYYPGKLDIAAEIARQSFCELADVMRETLRKSNGTATEKLRELLLVQLRVTFAKIETSPKVMELAQSISHDRPDLGNERLHSTRAILAECLSQGNANGEFDLPDVVFTAEMIQSATHIFCYPQLWSHLTLDKLERELNGVVDLLVGGLRRAAQPQTANAAAAA